MVQARVQALALDKRWPAPELLLFAASSASLLKTDTLSAPAPPKPESTESNIISFAVPPVAQCLPTPSNPSASTFSSKDALEHVALEESIAVRTVESVGTAARSIFLLSLICLSALSPTRLPNLSFAPLFWPTGSSTLFAPSVSLNDFLLWSPIFATVFAFAFIPSPPLSFNLTTAVLVLNQTSWPLLSPGSCSRDGVLVPTPPHSSKRVLDPSKPALWAWYPRVQEDIKSFKTSLGLATATASTLFSPATLGPLPGAARVTWSAR
ncbi:hypothetical protein CF327_g7342 [Tilletia walkeri]|nr:hypothetical protein CF327_g7342 [Tilletia walkeri]